MAFKIFPFKKVGRKIRVDHGLRAQVEPTELLSSYPYFLLEKPIFCCMIDSELRPYALLDSVS